MLDKLEIKDYKKFVRRGMSLHNLAPVNYLVGENGSGKSTVLDYIYDLGAEEENTFLFKSGLDANKALDQVDLTKACGIDKDSQWKNLFLDFLDKRVLVLDLLGYVLIDSSKNIHAKNKEDVKIARDFLKKIGINIPELKSINSQEEDSEELSGGSQKIFNLVYSILFIHKIYGSDAIIMIDEPSVHLHPLWQKKLPEIFEALSLYTKIQMFISTHSPFVVSGSGAVTENQKEFEVTQKVYFLKDFKTAGKRGEISTKGKNGYWGKKTIAIASKMLGAGLMDLVSPQVAKITKDAPTLIICEGEGIEEDSRIYNEIFATRIPSVLFVSARGSSQVHRTFSVLNDIKPGLSSNFNMIMLRDRDHEFPRKNDIQKYESINENHKILHRRAVECYIYNSEVASLLLAGYDLKLSPESARMLDRLNQQIQQEVERAIPDNTYKIRLLKLFNKVTFNKIDIFSDGDVKVDLARLITPESKTYKELEETIFGS